MNAMESKDPSSSTGTKHELDDFVSMLTVYCEQNDDTPGLAATKALGAYAEAPIGPGLALNALHAAMDEHASRQVATAILKHIPKKLREYYVSSSNSRWVCRLECSLFWVPFTTPTWGRM